MAQSITFHRYALMLLRRSFGGSVSDANSWAWIGGPLVFGALTAFGFGKVIHIDHLTDLGKSLLYFSSTVAVAYLIRLFVWAPYSLYREMHERESAAAKISDALELRKLAAAEAQAAELERANTRAEFEQSLPGRLLKAKYEAEHPLLVRGMAPRHSTAYTTNPDEDK